MIVAVCGLCGVHVAVALFQVELIRCGAFLEKLAAVVESHRKSRPQESVQMFAVGMALGAEHLSRTSNRGKKRQYI